MSEYAPSFLISGFIIADTEGAFRGSSDRFCRHRYFPTEQEYYTDYLWL